ncbi:unnamed protein product [Rotaria magnacalcarata]|uniref:Carbohydrate sulfotransferase n=4 Tax=Rotaria magnacalcarata TaxID=392030 RepID=A0A816H0G0_9BILA|nr:unnamed protein product [Rotaria magnacalcarata]CAF1680778.1 unnamed protein product [Rotaria magnacalcarata]CAF4653356.1 unnamed protein product [Rotaria magnacalcarata]
MYCPVPKVATKTLLNVMLYMHVRDISEHLDNNWTNVDTARARMEQMINISAFIEDLRQNAITIPKTEEPKSLAAFLRIYLNILRFGSINGTSSSPPLNPWRLRFTFAFPYLRLHSLSNLSQIFSPSFTRVIFVRHPFERLASAYKERIATLTRDRIQPEPEYDAMREMICRRRKFPRELRQPLKKLDECKGTLPSFKEFIRYILVNTGKPAVVARMNYHWQPYSVLCQVCKFKYNFIGKYEMFNDHFIYFLKRFNLSDWNIQKPNGASGLTKWDYQKFYLTLPDGLICQLIRLYDEDFRLFNYRVEDYINRTTLIQNCDRLRTL